MRGVHLQKHGARKVMRKAGSACDMFGQSGGTVRFDFVTNQDVLNAFAGGVDQRPRIRRPGERVPIPENVFLMAARDVADRSGASGARAGRRAGNDTEES